MGRKTSKKISVIARLGLQCSWSNRSRKRALYFLLKTEAQIQCLRNLTQYSNHLIRLVTINHVTLDTRLKRRYLIKDGVKLLNAETFSVIRVSLGG